MNPDKSGAPHKSGPIISKETWHIIVLIVISAPNPVALNIYLPAMPRLAETFQSSVVAVQLTLSLYLIAVAICFIIVGMLSDRFGRRPVILAGCALYAAGSLLCAMATELWIFTTGRLLQAAGGAAGFAMAQAITRDLYPRARSAALIGYIAMWFGVFAAGAPVAGGYLEAALGWRWIFYSLALLALANLVLVAICLEETRPQGAQYLSLSGFLRQTMSLLAIPGFWAFALTVAFTSGVFFAFLGGAPFVAFAIFDMDSIRLGEYMIIGGLGYFIGNWIAARQTEARGIAFMIYAGNWIVLTGMIVSSALFLAGATHPLALFGPMLLVGFGNGICMPGARAGAISVKPKLAGTAAGLSGCLQLGLGGVFASLTGWLAVDTGLSGSVWPLLLVMTGLAVLGLATALVSIRLDARSQDAPCAPPV